MLLLNIIIIIYIILCVRLGQIYPQTEAAASVKSLKSHNRYSTVLLKPCLQKQESESFRSAEVEQFGDNFPVFVGIKS